MAARSLALFVLLVVLLPSCNTWPSHPVDGGVKGDTTAALDASNDGGANAAIDASEDANDRDGADAPAAQDVGGDEGVPAEVHPEPETGSAPGG